MGVARVLFCQPLQSRSVERRLPRDVELVSSPSFARANRTCFPSRTQHCLLMDLRVAEVTIMLKNQGDEAYKPQEYGKSIVITRRFTKDGNSSYKIKSKDGRVISTKKDELSAICDHMGIQVDNPLNVLTQGQWMRLSCRCSMLMSTRCRSSIP